MIRRVRLAGVAVVALLASASVVRAQAPDTTTARREGALPGRGAVGAQAGSSFFLSEGDYSQGAQPRMSFAGHFRYVISDGWQWQVSPYFTWSAYAVGTDAPFADPNFPAETDKDFHLTQIVGASGQIQKVFGRGRTRWHLGAGPAIYRVVVQNHRKVLRDPVTEKRHQGTYLGGTAEIGVERFLKSLPNTSLEWTLAYQAAFAKDDQFPSGYNGSVGAIELRFGAHYYFEFKKPKAPDLMKAPAR
ncbi:MAG: hypothetical protein IT347_07680 [Candidatus Eisenbacteria bacterium]|nr:hypothetical protein [Candidatus Eisenbacteria bacterium]